MNIKNLGLSLGFSMLLAYHKEIITPMNRIGGSHMAGKFYFATIAFKPSTTHGEGTSSSNINATKLSAIVSSG